MYLIHGEKPKIPPSGTVGATLNLNLQLTSKGAVEHGLEKVVQAATARRLLSLQSLNVAWSS